MKNRVMQSFIPACSAGVMSIAYLPSQHGAAVMAGGGDGTVTLLQGPTPNDLRDEKQINLDGALTSMSLKHDGSEVMVTSAVGTAFRIRCKDLTFKCHNQVSAGALYDVEYIKGVNDQFLTCGGDGVITLWDANDYSARLRCPTRSRSYPISVTGSEDIIVAGLSDGKMLSFDSVQGQSLWHIDNAHKGGVTSMRLPTNVRFVVSGGAEGELRVWELKTRQMVSHLKEHAARVNDIQLFPNDSYAVSCSRDRCLLTWDLRSEKRLTCHREKHGGINCLAVASNQTTVITAGQEKFLTYWDLRMQDPVRVIEMDEEVNGLSLSHDDRYLATAGSGLVVKVWDVQAAAVISSGAGHSRTINKVTWSPDSKQVVTCGKDNSILVWNFYQ
jgi:WD40 repeat protein